jgi:hypothetical protein
MYKTPFLRVYLQKTINMLLERHATYRPTELSTTEKHLAVQAEHVRKMIGRGELALLSPKAITLVLTGQVFTHEIPKGILTTDHDIVAFAEQMHAQTDTGLNSARRFERRYRSLLDKVLPDIFRSYPNGLAADPFELRYIGVSMLANLAHTEPGLFPDPRVRFNPRRGTIQVADREIPVNGPTMYDIGSGGCTYFS